MSAKVILIIVGVVVALLLIPFVILPSLGEVITWGKVLLACALGAYASLAAAGLLGGRLARRLAGASFALCMALMLSVLGDTRFGGLGGFLRFGFGINLLALAFLILAVILAVITPFRGADSAPSTSGADLLGTRTRLPY